MAYSDFKTVYDGHWAVKLVSTNPDNYQIYWVDNITSENISEYASAKKLCRQNVVLTSSSWVLENPATFANYPYRCDISITGVTEGMTPYVFYTSEDMLSQEFSPFAKTSANCISIWAKSAVSTTIPIIAAENIESTQSEPT